MIFVLGRRFCYSRWWTEVVISILELLMLLLIEKAIKERSFSPTAPLD